ncbi:hypothetical protein [Paenibacillus typhae]|uniref:Uncharacterized protein n=1 Tax=Paenibacillus typhae TaxID=1174501 RepID=A0A1G8F6H2_9BACL|nr:hypothetical protein [Paenibacillus typhae]SDH77599.1 hypothetical protein SAMN05216192_101144 [Paenibacillus typhae]
MKSKVYVSIDGVVKEAIGPQPKHALLFAAPLKSAETIVKEQREARLRNSEFLKQRFSEAIKR